MLFNFILPDIVKIKYITQPYQMVNLLIVEYKAM